MSNNLGDRAKRLSTVRGHRDATTLALDRGGFAHQRQAGSFLLSWLRPQHDTVQWVAGVDSGRLGSMTVSDANDHVLSHVGRDVYDAAAAATAALGKQPYQYGDVSYWVEEEHQALLEPMRNALGDMGRTLLDETLQMRRRSEQNFATLAEDVAAMTGVQRRLVQNASLYLTLRQSCPIVLVDGLDQRFAASETGSDQTLLPGQVLRRDEWKNLTWWVECGMPPPPGPPHWSDRQWSTQGRPSLANQQAEQLVLKHLGASSAAEGRLRLLAETPVLGFLDRMFSVSALITTLLEPPDVQLASLQRAFAHVQGQIVASNDTFANEIRDVTDKKWTRYAPLIRFLADALIEEGYDSRLVQAARDLLIDPARRAGWSDHLLHVFTVAAVALAFFPPLALAAGGAALASAGLGVGKAIIAYRDAIRENEARRHLSDGQPAAIDALQLIEDPSGTDHAGHALLIELMFAASTVIPMARTAGNLVRPPRVAPAPSSTRPTARQRQIEEVAEEREHLLAERQRVSDTADDAAREAQQIAQAKRMVDRDRALASEGASTQRVDVGAVPETPASRAITNEQRGLADARNTRDSLVAQRGRAEREVAALTDLGDSASDILNLSDKVPTAREYRQLVAQRDANLEHLRHLDPDDIRHRQALEVSIAEAGESIRAYETLREARLRLPAMRSDDADQLIEILRYREASRHRAQELDQQIRQVQSRIDALQ